MIFYHPQNYHFASENRSNLPPVFQFLSFFRGELLIFGNFLDAQLGVWKKTTGPLTLHRFYIVWKLPDHCLITPVRGRHPYFTKCTRLSCVALASSCQQSPVCSADTLSTVARTLFSATSCLFSTCFAASSLGSTPRIVLRCHVSEAHTTDGRFPPICPSHVSAPDLFLRPTDPWTAFFAIAPAADHSNVYSNSNVQIFSDPTHISSSSSSSSSSFFWFLSSFFFDSYFCDTSNNQ